MIFNGQQKRTRILLCDNKEHFRQRIVDALAAEKNFDLIGICESGSQALHFIKKDKPDIVVCTRMLRELDAPSIIERSLMTLNEEAPSFICFSSVGKDSMIERAIRAGASYFLIKPFKPELLIKRIHDLVDNTTNLIPPVINSKKDIPRNSEARITEIFLLIGIPANIKGYQYMRESIKHVLLNPNSVHNISNNLYPYISDMYDTTPGKVERAIRHSIDTAWNRGKIKNINNLFGYVVYEKYDKPTNGEFIALLADRIRLENELSSFQSA